MKNCMAILVAVLLSFFISNAFAVGSANSKQSAADSTNSVRPPRICDSTDSREKAILPPPALISENTAKDASPPSLKLKDWIRIEIPQIKIDGKQIDAFNKYFVKQQNKLAPTPVLYLNDMAIKGLQWEYAGCGQIQFLVSRTDESRDAWTLLLTKFNKQEIMVGIGTTEDGFITDVAPVKLELTTDSGKAIWIVGMTLLIAALCWLGWTSNLLRDIEMATDKPRRYSLGRCQMAWWFVLTVGAFSYIYLRTGDLSAIPNSILALMGISASTTVLGAVIDINSNKVQPEVVKTDFFVDILSDDDGISFHRLQMFVWTILLGVIFIQKVCQTFSIPDFDPQLLGLMGIASGTYLGFKIPAAQNSASGKSNP